MASTVALICCSDTLVLRSMQMNGDHPIRMSSTNKDGTVATIRQDGAIATTRQDGVCGTAFHTYKCTLSPQLRKMADTELGENRLIRKLAFEGMRQLMKKRPDINFSQDERFLLRFLRAKKFEVDRAFKSLVKYYELHKKHPDFFKDYKKSSVKHVLDDGMPLVLASRDKEGRPIVVLRTINWDPSRYSVLDIVKALFMVLEDLVEDEEAQVTGINLLVDLEGMGTQHVMQMGPNIAKKVTSIFQNCVPVRLHSIHFVNEPMVFDAAFAILKAFMADKMRKRVIAHGTDFSSLHKHFPASILPSNWRGTLGPYSNTDWKRDFLAQDRDFAPAADEGVLANTKKSKGHSKKDSIGSSKKLLRLEESKDRV
ncbi:alpha-tocopherol transfer protein-like [Asterias rubens]|uniref:alpha-tocopherol transfer protein-like n=1 Tax=Asterias rubens TaxID=7604 RepID=UPI0014554C84|nr:alpha-tocopherol transfer protein-like [Asterias rubens]